MKNMIAKIMSALIVVAMVAAVLPMKTAAASTQDTLVVGMQNDAASMNFFDPDTNSVWKSNMVAFNFESLMAYTPDFKLYPVLAAPSTTTDEGADYTVDSLDGLNLTFNIRQGVRFTDGTPMTAKDVAYSFQTLPWGLYQTTLLDPLLWASKTWTAWDGRSSGTHIGVEAVGDYQVKFHLTQPFAMFWYGTMTTPIIPSNVWKNHDVALDAATLTAFGITGATEYQPDYTFGSPSFSYTGTETPETATIGTGPWMMASGAWTEGVGTQIDTYDGYWGKNSTITWNNVAYPYYPKYLRHIQYKQYGALDVSILALRKGEIQYIPWNIGAGFYNSLKTDPNIGFQIPQDQGFFYMAFNMRKSPMSDLAFRKAAAYCVDKDYIVNRLMGGYGTKGTVPIAITNPLYINQTIPDYVSGLDLSKATAALVAAGYVDVNSDGWREKPDTTPLKVTILTPPKDYDPVRADAGIMIAKNLKSIGVNAESSPTSFDTIVSKAYVSYDFDIYCLGWTVGAFPENYLKDFFHSDSDVAVNSAGSNSMGYHNATVDTMIDKIATTMDNTVRTKLVKDVCGAVMKELPYDVLYYRKNIEAFRQSTWQGWIPAFGTCWNGFTLSILHPPGGAGGSSVTSGEVLPGALQVQLDMPANVAANTAVTGRMYASQDGMPVSGVTLTIVPSYGANISKTTDVNGYADFTSTVPFQSGAASYNVIAVKGTLNATAAATTNVVINPIIRQLSLSCVPDTKVAARATNYPVVLCGGTRIVTAKVTDENGKAVKGVAVDVDKTLLVGTVALADPTNVTGNTGLVNFTYTAPAVTLMKNTNMMDFFKAKINVANVLVPEVQEASLVLGVENPNPSAWFTLDITGCSNATMDNNTATATPKNVSIEVTVNNFNGTVAVGKKVDITLSNKSIAMVTNVSGFSKSNATGKIRFNLTCLKDPADTNLGVTFKVNGTSYGTMESVSLLVNGSATGSKYAAVAHYSSRGINHTDSTDLTLTLYNRSGLPAKNVPVMMYIASTDMGFPSTFPDGVDMSNFGTGEIYPYLDKFDDFDTEANTIGTAEEGNMWKNLTSSVKTDVNGTVTTTIEPFSYAGDQAVPVSLMWGSNLRVWADSWNWVSSFVNYSGSITSSYVQGRAPLIAMGSAVMDKAYMTKEANYGKVTAKFYNLAGPIDASKVRFYEGKGSTKKALTYEKTVSGTFTYITTPAKIDSTLGIGYTMLTYNGDYAYGDLMPYSGAQIATMPFEFTFPYIYTPSSLVMTGKANTALVAKGGSVGFSLEVTDLLGNPVEGATVNGGGVTNVTNASGEAVLTEVVGEAGINTYTFSAVSGYNVGTIALSTFGGIAKFAFSNGVVPTNVTVNTTATITVTVANSGPVPGDATVDLSVDGAVVQSKVVTVAAGGSQVVSFSYVPNSAATSAAVVVGGLASQTMAVYHPAAVVVEEVDEGFSIMVVAGAAVGMLVLGLLIGWLVLGKMMGGGAKPAPKPAPKAAPKPAPKPVEPKTEEPKEE